MLKIICIFIALLLSIQINAQRPKRSEGTKNSFVPLFFTNPRAIENSICIDTSYLEIGYVLYYTKDSIHSSVFKDNRIIQLGYKFSKDYSLFANRQDSIAYNSRKKKESTYAHLRYKENEQAIWTEHFKNYQDSKSIITARFFRDDYRCEESITEMIWQIIPETASILTYTCQKATTYFRGRNYIAWFTLSIPISEGPWKFCGLPGLILKVYDSNKLFIYEVTSIEKNQRPIYYIDADYKNVSRNNLRKIDKHRHDDIVGYLLSNGVGSVDFGETTAKPGALKLPFIPTELE